MMAKSYRPKKCALCSVDFTPKTPRQSRCTQCMNHTCPDCGKRLPSIRLNRLLRNGSRRCMMCHESLNLPVGSTRRTSQGYLLVKCESGEWRLQHRVVMESVLGRSLLSSEIVHHIDHDRSNNDPSNLALCSGLREHLDAFHSEDLVNPPVHHNGRKRPGDSGYQPIFVS